MARVIDTTNPEPTWKGTPLSKLSADELRQAIKDLDAYWQMRHRIALAGERLMADLVKFGGGLP